MRKEAILERFFTSLISGDRPGSREVIDTLIDADCPASSILSELFWPTLEHIQNLHRNDQMEAIAFHFATRLMRSLVDQMQLRLPQANRRDQLAVILTGLEESEEIGGQMVADLLEADGYDVFYMGGGVAEDEVVQKLGDLNAHKLVIFGAVASTVPFTRLLIDRLHSIGACTELQVCVGGGIFNRAEGLAEEIGADLWAKNPQDLVAVMNEQPQRRMSEDQRTVGRKHRATKTKTKLKAAA